MKKLLICVIAVVSFSFAANDELLEKLSDATLYKLLYCDSQTEKIDEGCKKQDALLSEHMAKLSKDDKEKVRNLAAAKYVLEMGKDKNLEKLSDEALQNLLTCNPQVGNITENCKKQNALMSERIAKLSKDDQEKVRNLTAAKFVLEMEKAKKIDEERVKLREERAKNAKPISLDDSNDAVKKLADEMSDLFVKCKNKQLDEGECKKQEKLLLEREKGLSVSDRGKLQELVMQKLMEK